MNNHYLLEAPKVGNPEKARLCSHFGTSRGKCYTAILIPRNFGTPDRVGAM